MIRMSIGDKDIEAMVDTGASDCFLSEEIWEELDYKHIWDTDNQEHGRTVKFGDKSKANIITTAKLRCLIEGVVIYYEFHVVKNLSRPVIVGRNLLKDLQAVIKTSEGKVTLFTGNPVSCVERCTLKAWQEMVVKVKPWRSLEKGGSRTVLLEPSNLARVAVERAVNYVEKIWYMRIANFSDLMVYLDTDDIIAYAKKGKVAPLDLSEINRTLGLPAVQKRVGGEKGGKELLELKVAKTQEEQEKSTHGLQFKRI